MSDGQYARRRISVRGPITGLVLVALVAYGAYWGWQSAFGDTPAATSTDCPTTTLTTAPRSTTAAAGATTGATIVPPATTSPSTTPTGAPVLQAIDVTVNVYNATARPGLAANTASALRDRGFTIGETANDPVDRAIPGIAEIRASSATTPGVLLLIQYVPGATIVPDGRTGDSVDLVTGETFGQLVDPVSLTPVILPSTTPTC